MRYTLATSCSTKLKDMNGQTRAHTHTDKLDIMLKTSFFLHGSIATLQGGSGVSAPVCVAVRLVKDYICIYYIHIKII